MRIFFSQMIHGLGPSNGHGSLMPHAPAASEGSGSGACGKETVHMDEGRALLAGALLLAPSGARQMHRQLQCLVRMQGLP